MTYNVSMGTLNPTIPYHTWLPKSSELFVDVFKRYLKIIFSLVINSTGRSIAHRDCDVQYHDYDYDESNQIKIQIFNVRSKTGMQSV